MKRARELVAAGYSPNEARIAVAGQVKQAMLALHDPSGRNLSSAERALAAACGWRVGRSKLTLAEALAPKPEDGDAESPEQPAGPANEE